MLAGQLILLYLHTLCKCSTQQSVDWRANFEQAFVLNMSEGRRNKIYVVFCSR